MSMILPFLVYSLICFVVSFILVEYGQRYYYDEVTPYAAPKVLVGALIMGGLLTWTRSSVETMFTADIVRTLLILIVWAAIFVLIYRFQPLHGAVFALVAVLILPGIATIAVLSMTTKGPDERTTFSTPAKPLRKGTTVGGPPTPAPAPTETKK